MCDSYLGEASHMQTHMHTHAHTSSNLEADCCFLSGGSNIKHNSKLMENSAPLPPKFSQTPKFHPAQEDWFEIKEAELDAEACCRGWLSDEHMASDWVANQWPYAII